MKFYSHLFFLLILLSTCVVNSQPVNDDCTGAIVLTNLNNWCSPNNAYTNVNATQTFATSPSCWTGNVPSNDVWFSFTAIASAMNINVDGTNGGGTLYQPQVAVYTGTCNPFSMWEVGCSQFTSTNQGYANLYISGLNIGQIYYIVVDGYNDNTGTFKLCVNNFNPPSAPGQDCTSGAWLCSMETITQQSLLGAGIYETDGTCLDDEFTGPTDKNTIWYRWVCQNSGTLTFSIDPLIPLDDIDWVFYELPNGSCPNRVVLRCNSSSCVGATGLMTGSSNTNVYPGCNGISNELWCSPVNMIAGHTYGLLINNWTDASVGLNNGFTLTFGGTGTFVGPISDFTISPPPPYCTGDILTFTDASSNGANIFAWSFGQNASLPSSTLQGPHQVSYSVPGIKTVVLTVGNGSCNDVSYQTFEIDNCCTPPLITVQPQSATLCGQTSYTFSVSASGTGSLSYQWQFNGNDISGATSSSLVLNPVSAADSGNYQCIVSVDSCSTLSEIATLNFGTAAQIQFGGLPLSGCKPLTVQFTDNTVDSIVSRNWNFGDNSSSTNTSTIQNPTHTYNLPGFYAVTLTVSNSQGCSDTLTIPDLVQVYPQPEAIFTYSPSLIFEDEPLVTFTSNSTNSQLYLWSFGDNSSDSTSVLQNPVHTFPGTGNYEVWLWTESEFGCRDSSSQILIVRPFVTFYLPNAFSPNKDVTNDKFSPVYVGPDPQEYYFSIYDRWGKRIFFTENVFEPWDGTVKNGKGDFVQPGIYVYVISIKVMGVRKVYKGTVTVVY